MADWCSIRIMDCDITPRARMLLVGDHGPKVTLGDLDALTDAELVRSANVGAATLRELRALTAQFKARHTT